MELKNINHKIFIFSGLGLILIAFILKINGFFGLFVAFLVFGILLKILFLQQSFAKGRIKKGPALYLLFAGILLVVAGSLLKHHGEMTAVPFTMIHSGIGLKILALVLMVVKRKK